MEIPVDTPGGSLSNLERVRDITAMICALPAVATHDWCDRAAATLSATGEASGALVLVCTLDACGGIATREAAGVACAQPFGSEAETEDPSPGLRSRLQRLDTLAWTPRLGVPGGDYRLVHRISPDWAAGSLGRVLGRGFRGGLAAAAYRLGDSGARVLAAFIPTRSHAADPLPVLRTIFPLLAARALAVLGPAGADTGTWITRREQVILEFLADGKSIAAIAQVLGRSPYTVQDYIKTLHRKLNAGTRAELIARTLGRGAPFSVQQTQARRMNAGAPS